MQRADGDGTTASGSPRTPRRGPRPDGGVGRQQILDAAITQFGERGYQATTIRRVAETAGVDPKLVHYYFGTKESLFTTIMSETFRARGFPDLLVNGEASVSGSIGESYLAAVLTTLEDPGIGPAMIGVVRGLGNHEESRRVFLSFITEELLSRLAPQMDVDRPQTRLALAGSQLLGIVVARYILKIAPLADLPREDAARLAGPTIDRYILGDLAWGDH